MTDARFMLDTNIVSDVVRNPFGSAAETLYHLSNDDICISSIVLSEILFGIKRRGSERLTQLVEGLLKRIAVVEYDASAARHYAVIRSTLEARGSLIGTTDLFIAAHAISQDSILVTNNVREFSRVDGLKIENWIERGDA